MAQKYANQAESIKDVTDYILRFYNSEGLHSTLCYRVANECERLAAKKPPIEVFGGT
jgi:hypothetical protein